MIKINQATDWSGTLMTNALGQPCPTSQLFPSCYFLNEIHKCKSNPKLLEHSPSQALLLRKAVRRCLCFQRPKRIRIHIHSRPTCLSSSQPSGVEQVTRGRNSRDQAFWPMGVILVRRGGIKTKKLFEMRSVWYCACPWVLQRSSFSQLFDLPKIYMQHYLSAELPLKQNKNQCYLMSRSL